VLCSTGDEGVPQARVIAEDSDIAAETEQALLSPTEAPQPTQPWTSTPPDWRPGTSWYAARVSNLVDACKGIQHQQKCFRQGLADLEIHRRNYQGDGMKELRLLRWEFPSEHWKHLREGCSMHFFTTPTHGCESPSDLRSFLRRAHKSGRCTASRQRPKCTGGMASDR
jgi:hypothetical protein